MKKILSLILVFATMLSFAACTKETANEEPETKPENEQIVDTEEDVQEEIIPEEEKKEEVEEKPAVKPEVKPEAKPEAKPETKPETKPEVKPEEKPQTSQTVGNTLLSDFKAKAGSHSSAVSLAEALVANSVLQQINCGAMPVEPGFLTGFDNAEIKGFKEGAMFAPMIGTIPFVGYVFTLEDGVNASDFISTLKSSANLRWNICTTADEMIAGSSGNKVFFVMSPKSFEEQ